MGGESLGGEIALCVCHALTHVHILGMVVSGVAVDIHESEDIVVVIIHQGIAQLEYI